MNSTNSIQNYYTEMLKIYRLISIYTDASNYVITSFGLTIYNSTKDISKSLKQKQLYRLTDESLYQTK